MDQKNKFKVQDNQYTFPYHHISALDENCYPLRHRLDSPAFGYLCYIYHIKEMVEKSNPTSVLDVGCGDGRFISELSDDIEKVGCDLSYRAIQFAKGFNPQFTYYNEDVNNLNSVFDVVTCIETLEHVPDCDVDSFINDLANKTKKSGKVIISVPTTVVPLKNKHYRHYNIGTFNNELESSKAPLQIKKISIYI
ncbi:class I SAM-dependent methyltransferase [Methanohalophilus profundi]|uniref:class I SAM-dependent methyltransferase n=1 Tax=Methanohalophilus profundi TaxID=2138083 RepID=UPI00101D45A9|nr:class I SAM-dependent methyltransferase [Methanohalophilus profundi]